MVHVIFLIALLCMMPELNKKYPYRIFSFAVLFLFLALRFDYGNDYMGYFDIHSALSAGLPAWGQSDILFKNLNVLIPNFYIFIAVISLFYIFTIHFLISKNLNVRSYWFAILILLINPYLFLVHSSSIRQTLAICFFVFAVHFATQKKIAWYFVFVLLATGMHTSAIILLPLYFILNEKKITQKQIIIIFISIAILIATPAFDLLANKILEYMPSHYRIYYDQGLENSLRATLLSSFFFFFLIFNLKLLKGKEIIYGKLALIASIVSLLAFKVSMINRVGMYFDIFMIISIPTIFGKMERGLNKKVIFIIMLAIFILRYYSFFANPMWESFLNYTTIFNQ